MTSEAQMSELKSIINQHTFQSCFSKGTNLKEQLLKYELVHDWNSDLLTSLEYLSQTKNGSIKNTFY